MLEAVRFDKSKHYEIVKSWALEYGMEIEEALTSPYGTFIPGKGVLFLFKGEGTGIGYFSNLILSRSIKDSAERQAVVVALGMGIKKLAKDLKLKQIHVDTKFDMVAKAALEGGFQLEPEMCYKLIYYVEDSE